MPESAFRFRFPIDHIVARQHDGKTESNNLALACLRCNGRKGPNLAGVDPDSGQMVRLFHPRQDSWADHFVWDGAILIGKTAEGRATIAVLAINDPSNVAVREALIAEGESPPELGEH